MQEQVQAKKTKKQPGGSGAEETLEEILVPPDISGALKSIEEAGKETAANKKEERMASLKQRREELERQCGC